MISRNTLSRVSPLFPALVLIVLAVPGTARAEEAADAPARWNAPPYWTPPASVTHERRALAAGPTALPFIALPPCRLVDTRGNAPLTGGFLPGGSVRSYTLTGVCNIPANAQAVSLNAVAVGAIGPGFLLLFPEGTPLPTVSTLNFVGGQTVANAALVPLGSSGAISAVFGVSGADLVLDTNGYYAPVPSVSSLNALTGDVTLQGSGAVTITPGAGAVTISVPAGVTSVTGTNGISASPSTGAVTLTSNATFVDTPNMIVARDANAGFAARSVDLTGNGGNGGQLLLSGVSFLHGYGSNTFLGRNAGNTTLTPASAGANTAVGSSVLSALTLGNANTAVGYFSAWKTSTGAENTALGYEALQSSTTGSQNTALGFVAGSLLTSGSNNVYVANPGVASEDDTIRIGSGSGGITPQHTRFFLAAVRGVTTGIPNGVSVLIDSNGQLGTATSSIRFKDDVRDMGDESAKLMRLRPVTFRYKAHGPDGPKQYGLIAEEVDAVLPELVARSKDGEIETVMYHELPALLLNEMQRLEKRIAALEKQLAATSRPSDR